VVRRRAVRTHNALDISRKGDRDFEPGEYRSWSVTADHVHLVEPLAGAAAVAIQNAQLYEKIRTLNKVGRVLTGGIRLSEDEVL
jgi:GAF domain-containing protein